MSEYKALRDSAFSLSLRAALRSNKQLGGKCYLWRWGGGGREGEGERTEKRKEGFPKAKGGICHILTPPPPGMENLAFVPVTLHYVK